MNEVFVEKYSKHTQKKESRYCYLPGKKTHRYLEEK